MSDPGAPTVGNELYQRRQELALSLREASQRTRIREDYLRALEEDRYRDLPGPAYLSGFLRNYADLLELDGEDLLDRCRDEIPQPEIYDRKLQPSISSPAPARRPSVLLLAAVGVILLVVAAGLVWRFMPQAPNSGTAAQASGRPEEGKARTVPVSVPRSPEAVPEDVRAEADKPLPSIAPGGSTLRLEALKKVVVTVQVDRRSRREYALEADTVLHWDVVREARIEVADPEAMRLWLDGKRIDVAGRKMVEVSRQAPPPGDQP